MTGRDRCRGADGCHGENRTGDEGANGAECQDEGGEDGTPNSHDDLNASTEAAASKLVWRPHPARVPAPIIASLRLITKGSVRLSGKDHKM